MSEAFNPSFCTVEEATLTSVDERKVDITALIYGVGTYSALTSSALMGTIQVYDSVGTLHNHPLRGEERLDLTLKGHDFQTEVIITGQIVRIDNVKTNTAGDGYFYDLHFVTLSSYEAGIQSVIAPYQNMTGSAAAKSVFKKYFNKGKSLTPFADAREALPIESQRYKMQGSKERRFYLENSKNKLHCIIPDFSPAEAMNFLASKSLATSASPSNMFRFFETYNGYYWCTDEWLLKMAKENKKKIKDLYYMPFSEKDPRKAELISQTLQSFENTNHVNTEADIDSGGYTNTVLEIDLITHHAQYHNFNYEEQKRKFTQMGGAPLTSNTGAVHSEKFIKKTFTPGNGNQSVVFRDWQADGTETKPEQKIREPQNMVEIIQNRKAYNHHLNNSQVQISIQGRLDLQPGEVVNVIVQEPNVELSAENNERLSGLYLISSVSHSIQENQLNTSAEITKYDWNRGDL
jgi:hypothetical protein